MEWRYADSQKVQRFEQGQALAIPEIPVLSRTGKRICRRILITGEVGSQGTSIRFAFTPVTEPPNGCCEAYGFIQHVADGAWRYDNAAWSRFGAPSQPDANPQGQRSGDRWHPNPWYGGPGNAFDQEVKKIRDTYSDPGKQEEALEQLEQNWPRNPRPQTEIHDHPGSVLGFVTQLVCVESGTVMAQYRWVQNRRRGSLKWRFIGSPGMNMSIMP